jgi:hypothetical protein
MNLIQQKYELGCTVVYKALFGERPHSYSDKAPTAATKNYLLSYITI